jgi:hypothetical protein
MSRRARERGERCWEKAIKAPEYERFNSYDVYPNDTKRSYVERQEKDAFLTCAVIINGEWYEKNYSRDAIEEEINNQKWRPEFIKLLDKISNDAVLTLVDCHI